MRAAFEEPAEGAADAGADRGADAGQHRSADDCACKKSRRHRSFQLIHRPAHGEGYADRAFNQIQIAAGLDLPLINRGLARGGVLAGTSLEAGVGESRALIGRMSSGSGAPRFNRDDSNRVTFAMLNAAMD